MLTDTSDSRDWPLAGASIGIALLGVALAATDGQPPLSPAQVLHTSVLTGVLVLSVIGLICGLASLKHFASGGVVAIALIGLSANITLGALAAMFLTLGHVPFS